jgi:hypothetical protein
MQMQPVLSGCEAGCKELEEDTIGVLDGGDLAGALATAVDDRKDRPDWRRTISRCLCLRGRDDRGGEETGEHEG